MKIKTLLFGAGQGARRYMVNTASEREFVGFLDNDERKHGKEFEGIIVYSPDRLSEMEFDEIVITTQWALEVKTQLIDELGIDPAKVILPQKNQLKNVTPFANPDSLQLGRNIIAQLSALAINRNIPLVVDFGTLLGLVRDQDIIPWDDDIDFSAPLESAPEIRKLLYAFVAANQDNVTWHVKKVVDREGKIAGYWLKFTDSENKLVEFTTSLCFRQNREGKSLHLPSLGMWFSPEKHFLSVELIHWNNVPVQVPYDHKEYLAFQYGDWQTPKKNIQLSDYANLQQVEFSDIQRAGFQIIQE